MSQPDYPVFIGPTRAGKAAITNWMYISRRSENMYLTHPVSLDSTCKTSELHHINECGYQFKGTVSHEIRDKAPATFRDLDRLAQRVVELETNRDEVVARLNHLERAVIHLERVNSAIKKAFRGSR